ncbi:diacylglycerol kinase family protein [Paenibacillus macquariensis]|uniref:Undecaprenol kinase n=1 Tax=Paenibacillus macquariensis TaxID=948756 RepID=A0ABY1K0Z8_9BACL|nr:diacylglycerol kinase family protein [Paenibacillus macquariensis]MEC0091868.1 diacylglycerol kinase family protein [Paenibacillus macquariensis]OAB32226.1 diacylglycerol kinase [Paenibacillus macquariensis subsp. macquariensis]SIR10609.1 undecaprenol kinase [Paenibacillus macquariensis]
MSKKSFLSSFGYAAEGIRYAMTTQRNMKVHGVAALFVILAAAVLQISTMRWLFLLLAITLVLTAEMFNTALEAAVDLVSSDIHPLAKAAKDTAAGAVLLTAAFAVVVGIVVFYRPLVELFGG